MLPIHSAGCWRRPKGRFNVIRHGSYSATLEDEQVGLTTASISGALFRDPGLTEAALADLGSNKLCIQLHLGRFRDIEHNAHPRRELSIQLQVKLRGGSRHPLRRANSQAPPPTNTRIASAPPGSIAHAPKIRFRTVTRNVCSGLSIVSRRLWVRTFTRSV